MPRTDLGFARRDNLGYPVSTILLATASTSMGSVIGTERHSLRLRNQVHWRLANCRVWVLNQINRLFEGWAAADVFDDFSVADGLGCCLAKRFFATDESLDFLDQAFFEHDFNSPIHTLVEQIAGPVEKEDATLIRAQPAIELLLPLTDRRTRLLEDFQGADEPAGVVGMEALSGRGIHFGELTVKRTGLVAFGCFK